MPFSGHTRNYLNREKGRKGVFAPCCFLGAKREINVGSLTIYSKKLNLQTVNIS